MADHFYPKARADLYAVLDDGWDVDFGVHPDTQRWKFGACELSAQRFPSFAGEPRDGLKALNDAVKLAGWLNTAVFRAILCGCTASPFPPGNEIYSCYFNLHHQPPYTYRDAIYDPRRGKARRWS